MINQINLIASFRMQCQVTERKWNLIMYFPFFLNKARVKSQSNVATSFQTEKTEGMKGLTKTDRRASRILLLTVLLFEQT